MDHFTREELSRVVGSVLGARLPGQKRQGLLEQSLTQKYEIGSQMEVNGGIYLYRYGQAGALDLDAGKLMQMPVPDTNHNNLAVPSVVAIGATVIPVTVAGANVTAHQYDGGTLIIYDSVGAGQTFHIVSHTAAAIAAVAYFTVLEPVNTALTAASKVSLLANPYLGVIVHPSPPTAGLVGVPLIPVTTLYYAWFCRRGPCAVLTQGTVYLHRGVTASITVDGAVRHAALFVTTGAGADADVIHFRPLTDSGGADTANAVLGGAADPGAATEYNVGHTQTVVGRVLRVGADTKYSIVNLALE